MAPSSNLSSRPPFEIPKPDLENVPTRNDVQSIQDLCDRTKFSPERAAKILHFWEAQYEQSEKQRKALVRENDNLKKVNYSLHQAFLEISRSVHDASYCDIRNITDCKRTTGIQNSIDHRKTELRKLGLQIKL